MNSVAPNYYITIRSNRGEKLAVYADYSELSFEKKLNDIGNYTVTFVADGFDPSIFQLDGQIEIYRSVPGCSLDWYLEFVGLHRKSVDKIEENIRKISSIGSCPNELLTRGVVAYKAGTIRADKSLPAEYAMLEYVEENLGPTADNTVVGRLYLGGLENFYVEYPTVAYGSPVYTGSRAYENILDVVKDISKIGGVDFSVEKLDDGKFIFKTYKGQRGKDRTVNGLNKQTGRNRAGEIPVVFSMLNGNVSEISVEIDRTSEVNVAIVQGKGDGSTRTTVTVSDDLRVRESPFNRREASKSGGSYDEDFETYNLTNIGQEMLKEGEPKVVVTCRPIQRPQCLYGLHYSLGDFVTVHYNGVNYDKKITSVKIDVANNAEDIAIEME